jgi:hypothetical protein
MIDLVPPQFIKVVNFAAHLIMTPKHGLAGLQAEERRTKRSNSRSSPNSRSVTPTGIAFSVQYIPSGVKGRPQKKNSGLVHLELQDSPFVAIGLSSDAELDQYYTITPSAEWESMKRYNNFINKLTIHYKYIWSANGLFYSPG